MFFFELSTAALIAVLLIVVVGTTLLGILVGRRLRHLSGSLTEPFAVLQAALLGVVGLVLAFGLSLAVQRYENRRAGVVDDANKIGTTYLRAQTLAEPMRTDSMEALRDYIQTSIALTDDIPGGDGSKAAIAEGQKLQRELWGYAGLALDRAPDASAPRLYVESLNEMIDQQTVRVAGLNNRVPNTVLLLEIFGASLALGLLAAYLSLLGRGVAAVLLAAVLVSMLLFVICDLDRPTRGTIQVPDTPLVNQAESMELPPAAAAPEP